MEIIELGGAWREKLASLMLESWGGPLMVSRGVMHDIPTEDGFIAIEGDKLLGAATYAVSGENCEITMIEAFEQGRGIGTALLNMVAQHAREMGCRRMWLITTNDNTPAIRFYQLRGMDMAALHWNSIEKARELKPAIPHTGVDGIPIRHEIEFELLL